MDLKLCPLIVKLFNWLHLSKLAGQEDIYIHLKIIFENQTSFYQKLNSKVIQVNLVQFESFPIVLPTIEHQSPTKHQSLTESVDSCYAQMFSNCRLMNHHHHHYHRRFYVTMQFVLISLEQYFHHCLNHCWILKLCLMKILFFYIFISKNIHYFKKIQ